MLSVLETRIAHALTGAVTDVPVVAGPSTEPAAEQDERVEVSATLLEVVPPRDDDWAAARGPSFLLRWQRWEADERTLNFTTDGDGEIIEVEAPAGFPRSRGNDYVIEGRSVRFHAAPASEVVATLRGEPARGFQELRPAKLRLVLTVWARGTERADGLLGRALDAALRASASLGNLEAAAGDDGVRHRLIGPTAALVSIERTATMVGSRAFIKASVTLVVRGDLEITVALGAAERPRTIDTIFYAGVKLP